MADPADINSLYTTLNRAVLDYFQTNHLTRFANRGFFIRVILMALLTLLSYGWLLVAAPDSVPVVIVCYFLFHAGSILLLVNLAHDASHRSISRNPRINKWLSHTWNIMGISSYLWERQHHHSHHRFTGIPGRDVDIDENTWLRYNPQQQYRPWFRYQHLYAPFLYLLFGLYVVLVKDFIMLFSGRLRAYGLRPSRYFTVRLLLTKITYLFLTIGLPIICLPQPAWLIILIDLLGLSLFSGMMLLVLVIPHINKESALYERRGPVHNRDEWVLLQLHCNTDSSPGNRFLNGLLGGLNTHLIHHLFPHICHIHYPALTEVLRRELNKKGMPYRYRDFLNSIREHFHFLKLMGIPDQKREADAYVSGTSKADLIDESGAG